MASTGRPSSIIVKERMDRKITRFTLEWTIDKFETLRKKSNYHYSVGITMRELGEDDFDGRWRICANACVTMTENANGIKKPFVGASLLLTDLESDKVVDAKFVICVYTGKEASVIASRTPEERTFSRKEQASGFAALISHDNLFGTDGTPGLLTDDCLTFVIDVVMYGELKGSSAPEIVAADSSKQYQQFVRRQAKVLSANPYTDFKINSSDGQVFPTYRSLLMSHSPVFAAMLSHDSEEKRLSRCELQDIDGETVGMLLDYVHGCEIGKVTAKNAEKVLIMADKYEMLDLLAVCEGILVQSVTGENAVHYLVLASQRKLEKLKEAALNAIPKNMGTVLQKGALQEAWQFDPELMQTIMEHCSKKMHRYDTF